MSKPIDLGRSLSDMIHVNEISPEKPHYPDLCLEGDDRRLAEMPDDGVATIKYRVRSRTHREEKNGKGKEYSCTLRLEILSIDPPAPKAKRKDSNGDARKAMDEYFRNK